MIIKVMSLFHGADHRKGGNSWYVYDKVKEVNYDANNFFRKFHSKEELLDFFKNYSKDSCVYLPFMRNYNEWDYETTPIRVCVASLLMEDGTYKIIAFSTRMYLLNDKGDTIDKIDLY